MRRITSSMFTIVLMLAACDYQPNSTAENTISAIEPTEREKAILTTTASNTFVYDFSVDQDDKSVHIWVERYEFGELMSEDPNGVIIELDEKNGTIIFSTNHVVGNEDQLLFRIGVHSDGSTAVGEFVEAMPRDYETNLVSGWGSNVSGEVPVIPNMIVGSISYKSGDGPSPILDNVLESDQETLQEKLKEHDVAFLLRVNFTSKTIE
jgi:hypothetical protein